MWNISRVACCCAPSRKRSPIGWKTSREAARRDASLCFNNLLHHVSEDRLEQAYLALNRTAATGIDGQTWEGYGVNLQENLQELHRRIHTGSYHPRPSKRTWIPKPDGRQRPIGMAALEDKIVQQALVWLLGSIYEEDFLGLSYGFRPGRGQHQALDALYMALTSRKVSWMRIFRGSSIIWIMNG